MIDRQTTFNIIFLCDYEWANLAYLHEFLNFQYQQTYVDLNKVLYYIIAEFINLNVFDVYYKSHRSRSPPLIWKNQ